MSLFDVIRYPISDVPTLEELEAIPDEIFNQWTFVKESGLAIHRSRRVIWYLISSNHRFRQLRGEHFDPHRAEALRKIIREYNDNI